MRANWHLLGIFTLGLFIGGILTIGGMRLQPSPVEQKAVEPVTVMYSPRVATVTAVTLNIRDGAGTQAAVIGQTRQGDPVLLFGEPVVTNDRSWQRACIAWGWVATEYVK